MKSEDLCVDFKSLHLTEEHRAMLMPFGTSDSKVAPVGKRGHWQ
jgi:hypothetical protein